MPESCRSANQQLFRRRGSAKSKKPINYKTNMRNRNLITLLVFCFLSASPVKADSPLTSTPICDAYTDLPIVVQARSKSKMTKKFAKFLHSDKNDIDEKAAVINAIGWSIEGENNAELYSEYIFGKKPDELVLSELKWEDLFCLGYLQALDDYFRPEKSLPYFEEAVQKEYGSLTLSLVYTLAKAQNIMDEGNWCKIWEMTYQVLNDKSLFRDLREAAIKIIKDYMILYKC